jgi:hypothetical protein
MAPLPRQGRVTATYICTFVYLDEPQVLLLERGADKKIIAVAIDLPSMIHPFLGAEISFHQLQRYKREFVDLRYLFQLPYYHKWYIFDLADMSDNNMVALNPADQSIYKNEKYLPSHRFFARDHTEPDESGTPAEIGMRKHILDGNWEPIDFSRFFSRIGDLYSFYLALQKIKSQATDAIQLAGIRKAFTEHPFRGGSSYRNFYRDLADLVSFDERLAMGSIRKESPGYVNVAGNLAILSQVIGSMQHFSANYEDLEDKYTFLHKYLSSLGFLTQAPERLKMSESTELSIKGHAHDLSHGLQLNYEELDELTRHPLSTAKIVLSHYRRVRRYFLFFAEGRVQLPDTDGGLND